MYINLYLIILCSLKIFHYQWKAYIVCSMEMIFTTTFEEAHLSAESVPVKLFSEFYLVLFIFIFIYIVLSMFIGIFDQAYASLSVSHMYIATQFSLYLFHNLYCDKII